MTLQQEQQVKTRTAEQNARIAAFEVERRREAEQTPILVNDKFRKRRSSASRPSAQERLRLNVSSY
ncbi:hypothetical protein ACLK1V_16665 [Escherichia coli]